MSVKIRLRRTGAKKAPTYRVFVFDNGNFIGIVDNSTGNAV